MHYPMIQFLIKIIISLTLFICSGENVEDAFLETAKKIYQNIQDGRYRLTAEVKPNILTKVLLSIFMSIE